MRIGMFVSYADGCLEFADNAERYESTGLDLVSIAEAYSFDAVSQVGFLAARTRTVQLCTSIVQVFSRTPTLTAMTAAGLDYVSGGRYTLGIGASGPQVVEGFHGVPYSAPVGRTREIIEICRKVWRRERLEHDGRHYQLPLPADRGTGLGKPLKLINQPIRDRIPISLAALGEKNVALAAELAESWQPAFFHPAHAERVWGAALQDGFARRGPDLGKLDVMLPVSMYVGEPPSDVLDTLRADLALHIGGMGARERNFYNQLTRRYGYEDAAEDVMNLFLAGRHDEATAAVPEELARAVSLVGTESEIADQIAEFRAAGVTTLLLDPLATDVDTKIEHVRRVVEQRG